MADMAHEVGRTVSTVTSADGTAIAYERVGSGRPVILVDGALCFRGQGPNGALAERLATDFTVYTYDRRGRGESGDQDSHSVDREIEDLAAVIKEAGGAAAVYGISSGGALVLAAAARGLGIERVAVYEAPFVVDDSRPPIPADYVAHLSGLIAAGEQAAAVRYFMRTGVGLPAAVVALMRFMPAWSKLKAVAHTLPYDAAFVTDNQVGKPLSPAQWASLDQPALVVCGSKSPPWMQAGMRALDGVLPTARHRTLDGQTHLVKPDALAPVLAEFFAEGADG
jgi:pimeloyl-ACP methyl ester carboxylesterase